MDRPWFQFYDEDVPHSLIFPPLTAPDFLRRSAERHPNQTATVFFGARLTYRQLKQHVDRLAAGLHALGVSRGDRVAILLPNCPQTIIAYYATLSLGAVAVLTNPLYVERELIHQWGDAGVETAIVLEPLWPRVDQVRRQISLKNIVVSGIQDYLPLAKKLLYPIKARRDGSWTPAPDRPGVVRFRHLMRRGGAPPQVNVSPDDLACLQYTGGTTGLPKGAMLSHRNLVASVTQMRQFLLQGHQDASDKAIAILPLFHAYGMNGVMNLGVHLAASLVLLPLFDINMLMQAIEKERPTFFLGVPALYSAVLNHPASARIDLTSIRVCFSGAAPLPVEVMEQFEARTGARIAEAYGMTETASVTHVNPRRGRRKHGSIGVPIVGTDARIVDVESGAHDLPAGAAGELLIKGPQVMSGYWNRPQETAQVLHDGWLHTGDIARMDEDGYFFIEDRKKDVIITAGYNVYPREVEEVLYQHPKVLEAAVVGVPSKVRGERIQAFVVLHDGAQLRASELIDFCKVRLAPYKVPKSVVFRNELPKSMAGKVLRRALREDSTTGHPSAKETT